MKDVKRLALVGLGLAFLLGSAMGSASPQPVPTRAAADDLRLQVRELIGQARDRVFPALVNVEVETVTYWGGLERKGGSVGSGTIIDDQGHVITNYHVVENGQKYRLRLADRREVDATLVGEDPLTDLAVLKIDFDSLPAGEPLAVAAFGNSDELEIGDYVMAMGSPLALSRSVTLGIVSNTDRVFGSGDDAPSELTIGGQRTGLFTNWIQHDALIHRGNSGGPLVNLKGEIVGINTRGGGGQGFATPSNQARRVALQLIADGAVQRSWLGVSIRSIKDTGYERGVLVNSVVEDSPASRGGLKAGDLIVAVDGKPVAARYIEQIPGLLKLMANRMPGSDLALAVERDGESLELNLTTEPLRNDVGDEEAFRSWGFTGTEITELFRRELQLETADGVLISSTRNGGPAELAEPRLATGQIIRAIDGRKVETLAGLVERYIEIQQMDPLPEYLLIEFEAEGRNQLTLIKPKPDKDQDPPRELPKAWIGVATQPVVPRLAEHIGLDLTGHRVTRIFPRTKAADSDLQVGDVIVALNGERLEARNAEDAGQFSRRVRQMDLYGDEPAALSVLREGAELEITLPLERTRLTPGEARRDRNRDFDFTVREVTFFDRVDRNWDEDVKGVLVISVERGGWAADASLSSRDLLLQVNNYRVPNIVAFRRVMERIAEEQPERVVFRVLRGTSTSFLFVEPEWTPESSDADVARGVESAPGVTSFGI